MLLALTAASQVTFAPQERLKRQLINHEGAHLDFGYLSLDEQAADVDKTIVLGAQPEFSCYSFGYYYSRVSDSMSYPIAVDSDEEPVEPAFYMLHWGDDVDVDKVPQIMLLYSCDAHPLGPSGNKSKTISMDNKNLAAKFHDYNPYANKLETLFDATGAPPPLFEDGVVDHSDPCLTAMHAIVGGEVLSDLLFPVTTALSSALGKACLMLKCPPENSKLQDLAVAIQSFIKMENYAVEHIIMNQFTPIYPKTLMEHKTLYGHDIYLRMPIRRFICIYVLSGSLQLKAPGVCEFPPVTGGQLVVVCAKLYLAAQMTSDCESVCFVF